MKHALSAARIVTCDPARSSEANPLGVVLDSAVVIEDGKIAAIVPRASLDGLIMHAGFGALVITPGLVDAHTHAAWAGSRHDEYAVKMAGGDYRDIAAAGGGIASSQRAVAACSEADLAVELAARVKRMASLGVTTCEVKSGYGLEKHQELKQLRAIACVANRLDLPKIVPTLLALHALPKTITDRAAYGRAVLD
ncbi:MAG: imidazolonepropionase, partial [Polyangiaceae bacterium]